jgi:hypothetical protein
VRADAAASDHAEAEPFGPLNHPALTTPDSFSPIRSDRGHPDGNSRAGGVALDGQGQNQAAQEIAEIVGDDTGFVPVKVVTMKPTRGTIRRGDARPWRSLFRGSTRSAGP